MAYGLLEVSQVGEAEYPLIGVLHEHIFGRTESISSLRQPTADLLTLMAHLEGNPVGFLVAHGEPDEGMFVVDQMGVLPAYQRQGLGGRMLGWAEEHARARQYERIGLPVPDAGESVATLGRRRGYQGEGVRLIKVLRGEG